MEKRVFFYGAKSVERFVRSVFHSIRFTVAKAELAHL
jgi:hypothetical protein